MNYRDRHVVVTGGTGALGTAVVRALVERGASCHVSFVHQAEADFPDYPHGAADHGARRDDDLAVRAHWRDHHGAHFVAGSGSAG